MITTIVANRDPRRSARPTRHLVQQCSEGTSSVPGAVLAGLRSVPGVRSATVLRANRSSTRRGVCLPHIPRHTADAGRHNGRDGGEHLHPVPRIGRSPRVWPASSVSSRPCAAAGGVGRRPDRRFGRRDRAGAHHPGVGLPGLLGGPACARRLRVGLRRYLAGLAATRQRHHRLQPCHRRVQSRGQRGRRPDRTQAPVQPVAARGAPVGSCAGFSRGSADRFSRSPRSRRGGPLRALFLTARWLHVEPPVWGSTPVVVIGRWLLAIIASTLPCWNASPSRRQPASSDLSPRECRRGVASRP